MSAHLHRCAICGEERAACTAPLRRGYDGEMWCEREGVVGRAPDFYCAACVEAYDLDGGALLLTTSAADLADALAKLAARRRA